MINNSNFIILFVYLFFMITNSFGETALSVDLLKDGKWYNDEYSFTFYDNKTYKAFYTFGKTNGVMTGDYIINNDNTILIKKGNVEDTFNLSFMSENQVILSFIEDLQNPKSTKIIKDTNENIILWNDKSFVKSDKEILLNSGNIKCITTGYKLSATTDNVRIRKGPGTEYEYLNFVYEDVKTKEIKSFTSVLVGTNIRVLAKTFEKFKVNDWYNNWYFIEYKEPKNDILIYKTAWMFGEFINVPENKNRQITINYPENEAAFYGIYDMEIKGKVTGAPVKMSCQIKNSYGNIILEEKISEYDQKAGTFYYSLSKGDENLFIGSNIINIVASYSDGKKSYKQITVYIHESMGEKAKPVIYLYPVKGTKVKVTISPKNGISTSIPVYNNGWEISAKPDGTLINLSDGKTYKYLFWESKDYTRTELKSGFIVEKEKLTGFFKEKLTILGLNDSEIKDFNEFWIPLLNKKNYYQIYFYEKKSIEDSAPLNISPKPDTIIRIFFDSNALDKPIKINEQKLIPVKRIGFTVTEWGGMKYSD